MPEPHKSTSTTIFKVHREINPATEVGNELVLGGQHTVCSRPEQVVPRMHLTESWLLIPTHNIEEDLHHIFTAMGEGFTTTMAVYRFGLHVSRGTGKTDKSADKLLQLTILKKIKNQKVLHK